MSDLLLSSIITWVKMKTIFREEKPLAQYQGLFFYTFAV